MSEIFVVSTYLSTSLPIIPDVADWELARRRRERPGIFDCLRGCWHFLLGSPEVQAAPPPPARVEVELSVPVAARMRTPPGLMPASPITSLLPHPCVPPVLDHSFLEVLRELKALKRREFASQEFARLRVPMLPFGMSSQHCTSPRPNATPPSPVVRTESSSEPLLPRRGKGKRWYGIRVGRKIGVVDNWEECQQRVNGHKNAEFKSFPTFEGAKEYVTSSWTRPTPIGVNAL